MSLLPPEPRQRARPAPPRPAVSPSNRLPVGWPLGALLVLYPLWWALGLGPFTFILFAIPMAWQLHRNKWRQLPAGFTLWALLLVLVVVSAAMIDVQAPNTLSSEGFGKYVAYGMRTANYFAVTVILLYVSSVPRSLLPNRRIIGWLSVLFVWTVIGGVLGLLLPNVSFTTPMKLLLPGALADNEYVADLLTPSFAQVQDIIGDASARPSAPFEYSNAWGNNLSILLLWFLVGWWIRGSKRQRRLAPVILAVGLVPLIYSLNRGVWIGIILAAGYALTRLAINGRPKPLVVTVLVMFVAIPLFLVSPFGAVVNQRIENPHSNEIRASLGDQAVELAKTSPIVGYGSTRNTIGSERSLTIGKTPKCPRCGNRVIGSTGQLWLLLVSQGILGAVLYVSFFAYSLWYYRKDLSAVGIAGSATIVLTLFSAFFYTALVSPLALAMIAVGLLWRNKTQLPAEPT